MSEYHGYLIPQPESYPRINLIKKWSSLCIGIQFLDEIMTVFYNGKHVNKELEVDRKGSGWQSLVSRLPKDYFRGIQHR